MRLLRLLDLFFFVIFIQVFVIFLFIIQSLIWEWLMNANKSCNFLINFLLSILVKHIFQAWTIWKVPDFNWAIRSSCYQSSFSGIETARSDLNTFTVGKLLDDSSCFNVPDGYNSSIITRNNLLKLSIVKSKGYRVLMTSFYFFLSLKWPKVNLSTANKNTFADFIK